MLKGIEMKCETQRGSIHPLGLWMLARSLPEKLGSWVTPGEGRRVGAWQTLIWRVYRLGRELGCVKSQVLVKNGGLKQEDFTQKKAFRYSYF